MTAPGKARTVHEDEHVERIPIIGVRLWHEPEVEREDHPRGERRVDRQDVHRRHVLDLVSAALRGLDDDPIEALLVDRAGGGRGASRQAGMPRAAMSASITTSPPTMTPAR